MKIEELDAGDAVIVAYAKRWYKRTVSKRTPKRITVGGEVFDLTGQPVDHSSTGQLKPATPSNLKKVAQYDRQQKSADKMAAKMRDERQAEKRFKLAEIAQKIRAASTDQEATDILEKHAWEIGNL